MINAPKANSDPIYFDLKSAICYQDNYLLVVNKPSGLLSVPGRLANNKDSLISRIQKHYPSADVVHRLDQDTSGIMIIPLQKAILKNLAAQFRQRSINKQYQALVWNTPKKIKGTLEYPISVDWPNRPKQKIDFENGKASMTHYEVIERGKVCRLLLTPITGRTHQLRIHCATLGHPIIGCKWYNDLDSTLHDQNTKHTLNNRLHLHATRIIFKHPIYDKDIEIKTDVPF